MNRSLSLVAVGHATSLFLAMTFTICVGFDFVFPQYAMFQSWQKLLPGFEWISWKAYILGLIWSYSYGWYFALIWVPLYNYFSHKENKAEINKKLS